MSKIGAVLVRQPEKDYFRDFADFDALTICGKTLTERYVDILRRLGVEKIYLLAQDTDAYSGSGNIKAVRDLSEIDADSVLVIPLDVYVPHDALSILINYHMSLEPPVTLLVAPCENAKGMLSPQVDTSTGRVSTLRLVEEDKPDLVFTGILMCDRACIRKILPDIDASLPRLLDSGTLCEKAHWTGSWCRVDSPWDLLNLGRIVLETEFEIGVYIHPRARISHRALIEPKDGPVVVDEEAVIDHDAIVRGPVYIGKRTYVGNNALVRNYTIVESECTIGSSVDITESIVFSYSTIGRNAYISCSIVGPRVIVDPGVVTYSVKPEATVRRTPRGKIVEKQGAVIGEGSKIGAYTVIKPGTLIKRGTAVEPLSKI